MSTDPRKPSSQCTRYKVDALIAPDPSISLGDSKTSSPLFRLNATAIADAKVGVIENASIVLKQTSNGYETVSSGSKAQIDRMDLPITTIELTLNDRLVMPALVNAHTHLDLTHIGPVEHDPTDGFVQWVDMIRDQRRSDDQEIRSAVKLGIQRSLAGGSVAVGDIAGAPAGRLTDAPSLELANSPMIGVSYLEFFGIGTTALTAIRKIDNYLTSTYPESSELIKGMGIKIGLQPHAPNTVDLSVYRWATAAANARAMPMSTHLAETPEEREFIAQGTGPQREMLERFGVWDESVLDHIAKDNHPVEHLSELLNDTPYLVAHVNDATDRAIKTLAKSKASVAYCPRASDYFGAHNHFRNHRYRDMLASGVNVCLGTDSIVNLDTHDRISILDEMRFLSRRDGTDAKTLLKMATINGANALGLDDSGFTLAPGDLPRGLISIPIDSGSTGSWESAMGNNYPPEWVLLQTQHK
jgi:cytosine/adenosine deaminase-related metal-dependent hydrolase